MEEVSDWLTVWGSEWVTDRGSDWESDKQIYKGASLGTRDALLLICTTL